MGLIKGKKILIDSNFTKDNYFTENTYFKAIDSTSMPTTSADVQVHSSQPVFYSINTILNRLLDNDKFINRYLDCMKSTTVSREQLVSAFNEDITRISSDTFEKAYEQHIRDYHDLADPTQIHFDDIDKNYLKSDLRNFNEKLAKQNFMKGDKDIISSANVVFENDFVTEVEFNDSTTKSSSYILASVSNTRTNKRFKYELPASQAGGMTQAIPTLASVPFIYRKWLSGIKEFFIYLPTTFTFYHEGNGRGEDAGKDLNSDATLIWLKFNKRHFDLHHIYSTQICGQSLPMQCTMGSTGHFSDVMLPSIQRSLPISENTVDNADSIYSQNTNYFQMLFSCYGTDAQAIRILCD